MNDTSEDRSNGMVRAMKYLCVGGPMDGEMSIGAPLTKGQAYRELTLFDPQSHPTRIYVASTLTDDEAIARLALIAPRGI